MKDRIEICLTQRPKARPPAGELGFGRFFTDHMFQLDYEGGRGWQAPRVVPYGPLPLDPAASVLHYGQAMFEGMKAFRGQDGKVRLFRARSHTERLRDGGRRLCMPPLEPELAQQAIEAVVGVDADWVPMAPGTSLYIRPTLIAVDPFLGVRASSRYLFYVILSPVGSYYATGPAPLRIWIEERMVRAAPGGLGSVKAAANYASSLYATEDARARGYSQVLWLDAGEHTAIEEVGTMNLFVRIGDEVITPPLEGTILGGITRDSVLRLLSDWGVAVAERRVTVSELLEASRDGSLREVFGTGTASVIAPVGELGWTGGQLIVNDNQIGPLAQRLYEAITRIQHGTLPDIHGWMTEVPAFTAPRRRAHG